MLNRVSLPKGSPTLSLSSPWLGLIPLPHGCCSARVYLPRPPQVCWVVATAPTPPLPPLPREAMEVQSPHEGRWSTGLAWRLPWPSAAVPLSCSSEVCDGQQCPLDPGRDLQLAPESHFQVWACVPHTQATKVVAEGGPGAVQRAEGCRGGRRHTAWPVSPPPPPHPLAVAPTTCPGSWEDLASGFVIVSRAAARKERANDTVPGRTDRWRARGPDRHAHAS